MSILLRDGCFSRPDQAPYNHFYHRPRMCVLTAPATGQLIPHSTSPMATLMDMCRDLS